MCPETITELCSVGDWSLLIETLFSSLAFGLVMGFVVGLVVFIINKKG